LNKLNIFKKFKKLCRFAVYLEIISKFSDFSIDLLYAQNFLTTDKSWFNGIWNIALLLNKFLHAKFYIALNLIISYKRIYIKCYMVNVVVSRLMFSDTYG
jgi:hypothetical protein